MEASWFVFGPRDDARTAAEDYLVDRLPDVASTPETLSLDEIETSGGLAVYGWSYDFADVSATGWLYVRRVDGAWRVAVAVTEGIDAHRFSADSQGLRGVVSSTGDVPLVIDLVDPQTGEPFEPSTGEPLPPGPTDRQLGTAGRSERLGDEETIEIDTPTRGDCHNWFADVPEVAQIWDEAADLESIAVAFATTDTAGTVMDDLLAIDGVLAVAPTPVPSGSAEVEESADALVVASRSVPFRPTAVTCEAPIGLEAPPKRVVRADVSLSADTAEGALARYLSETADPPPWPAGYVELVSDDGSVPFGYAAQPERYLGIVRVEEGDSGWAVTEWEIVGC